jgi:hypothetical protein
MTTTDYILNALLVLAVLRQTRERKLDLRSVLIPLAIVFVVAHIYVHSLPTGGEDLLLLGTLAAVGTALGVLGGLATHVRRAGEDVFARVGWVAGALLIVGLLARMAFVLAAQNGLGPAITSFSAANEISYAAWPVALVAMALMEVVVRIAVVEFRGRRLTAAPAAALAAGRA